MQTEHAERKELPAGCGMCSDRKGWLPTWQNPDSKIGAWGSGAPAGIPCTCALGDYMAANFQPYRFLNREQRDVLNRCRSKSEMQYRAALARDGVDAPPSNVVSDFDPDDLDFLDNA